MGHLEVFLLFLPIFNCFTSNCTKRREPSWWTRDNCGLPKMSFLLVFWPPSTFFTADFPLWLSSVSNNNVNEYLHIRICRGLSNVVLQVITSTLWGRWVNFILLNSKVSKTGLGALSNVLPVTQLWAWIYALGLQIPCSYCHILLLLICIHWSASKGAR